MMRKDLIFKLGVLTIYIVMIAFYGLVDAFIPFCPAGNINHVASMLFCSSYLWSVITPEIIILISIIAILYWEKVKNLDYPLAIFPSVILVLLVGMGVSSSALTGWVGAIGPQTIVTSSIYSLPAVVVLTTLVYAGLIVFLLKRIDRTTFNRKYWSTFFFSLVAYTLMVGSLYMQLSSYLEQLGRS